MSEPLLPRPEQPLEDDQSLKNDLEKFSPDGITAQDTTGGLYTPDESSEPLDDGDGPDVLEQPASPEPTIRSEIDREGVIPIRVPEVGEQLSEEQLAAEIDPE